MRWRNSLAPALLVGAALVALWPAVAQRAPESILPPGFGEPDPPAKDAPEEDEDRPAATPASPTAPAPLGTPQPDGGGDVIGDLIAGTANNASAEEIATILVDLPPQARRSLDNVGLVPVGDGGLPAGAYGATDGRYLTTLMHRTNAPLASRWMQIVLRRALLSQTDTPAGVNGADWVAERAWLLLRMGEADMARALVARVDAGNFTPWLHEVALQAALATGEIASVCTIAGTAAADSKKAAWPLTQGMCAAMSAESGTASGIVDRVRYRGQAKGIDVLLAEKVVGAGTNSRRSVSIQWDGVEQLTAWRYGVATAAGVQVPGELYATVGPQVRAWSARAPLIDPAERATAAERAAAMGIFSSAALVDFFGQVWDATDPADRGNTTAERLRLAYAAGDDSARMSALRNLWDADGADPYARAVLTSRAAVLLTPAESGSSGDHERIVASLMAAGLDMQAARWASVVTPGSLAWGMLAVGTPRPMSGIERGTVDDIPGGEADRKLKMAIAALAGLGRLGPDDASALAEEYDIPLGRENSWTTAIGRAADAGQAATVVLLAAAGMQTREWRNVPPAHLYHIVAALRRVGMEPEARMIAAEALTRA